MEINVKLDITGLNQLSEAIALLASAVGVNVGAINTAKEASKIVSAPAQISEPQMVEIPEKQQVAQQVFENQAVPVTENTYTIEQLAVAATALVDAGKREALVALLNNYGVNALTTLPKEKYGAFATSLREMGAKI